MIIGHLPAGYVLSKLTYSRFTHKIGDYRTFMFWGMLGSIAPDLDMFYFHLLDHRSTHHHKYFSHFPILWLVLVLLSVALFAWKGKRQTISCYALIFSISGFVHLLLGTIVGDIWWLAPFVDRPFALATVPAQFHPWWLNFVLHWSFALELALVGWSVWLWRSSPNLTLKRDCAKARSPLAPR
jgi:hypothetical protein